MTTTQNDAPTGGGQQAPEIHDVPIGLAATGTRRETDSMGAIDVPADRYWRSPTTSAGWRRAPGAGSAS
jgi:fumarate hydratase class II